ncbi:MAG: hypothetical protein ACRDNF_17085 [Streptosporangiaceae bacterium]
MHVATNTAEPAIKVGRDPEVVAVTPNGKTAYVVNEVRHAGTPLGNVIPIDVATNTAGTPIPAGADPFAMVITP